MWKLALPPSDLLSETRVALILGRSAQTIKSMRRDKVGPPYNMIGGRVRYLASDLESWFNRELERRAG
jgi:predicted DNA-binding transcriptional regulator AlpA